MNATTSTESAGMAGESAGFPFPVDPASLPAAVQPPPPPAEDCPAGLAEPLVRIREEHNVSRRDIDPDALKVLYRLSRNNYIAYLVGGGVRDLLLGRKPKDFDISTNAKPEQIRALFRNCILIGRRFRLAHIRYGEKIIETSTFRRTPECAADPNDPEADLFQRDDNLFGTPREDALRRDFTVNGLFYDIETFSVIDYVGGMEDLAARRIRCIGDPSIRFREDPVRMVRAIRFASRLGFDLDPDTSEAIRKHRDELAKASPARLLEEITRLFAFSAGERAVRLLRSTGLLEAILPEVAKAALDEEARDLLWRRLQALDRGDTVLPDATPALIFATLLLDPLKRHLNRDWRAGSFPKLKFERIHSFLAPLSLRLKLPRRLVDRIVHVYLAQHRFANSGGKSGSIANFVTQDSFHESLALAEILLAADGGSQARLNQWRDMLAERMYGREEGGGQERRQSAYAQAPANEDDNAAGAREREEETAESDGQQGDRRMSRSARRRRNKRLRRIQGREAMAARETDGSAAAHPATEGAVPPARPAEASAEAEIAAAPHPLPPVDQPSVSEASAPPVEAAPEAPEPPPAKGGEGRKVDNRRGERRESDGGRNRRGRGRRREQPEAETAAPAPRIDAEAGEAEPFQPLTAAAFYAQPEPEKKKPGRRGKATGKSAKSKGEAAAPQQPGQTDSGRAKEAAKPLAMDKADEADIPMHWLDEI